ncbi:hypothetical protein [Streptomyces boninensis]|uniref:hypothetical protein n=1 Tax=Streptomyces boninensis TaxID=2039455 RepID=UPI003B2196CD
MTTEPHEVLTLEELNEEEAAESADFGTEEPAEVPDPEGEEDAEGVELADADELELMAAAADPAGSADAREGGDDGV